MRHISVLLILAACGSPADESTTTQAATKSITASAVGYENATSHLAATDVQAAVDELAARAAIPGPQGAAGPTGPEGPAGASGTVTLNSLSDQPCAGGRIRLLYPYGRSIGPVTMYCASQLPQLEWLEPPEIGIYDIDFGLVCAGSTATRVHTLRNLGIEPVTTSNFRSELAFGTDDPNISVTTTCAAPIGFSDACTVTITFSPTTGSTEGLLVFDTSTSAGGVSSLAYRGGAKNPAFCP